MTGTAHRQKGGNRASEVLCAGEVAKLPDVTTKTLRHYGQIRLIEPQRTESNYRVYTPEEVLRLLLQEPGLSLKQIRLILPMEWDVRHHPRIY